MAGENRGEWWWKHLFVVVPVGFHLDCQYVEKSGIGPE
jgi:hypothetical protein